MRLNNDVPFLSQQMDEETAKGNRKKTNDPKNIIFREESREMWKSIRAARSKSASQSVSSVTTRIEGGLHEYNSQEDVEAAMMEMCKKRFLLTYGTPLMNDSKLA